MSERRFESNAVFLKSNVIVITALLLLTSSLFGNLPHVEGFTPNDPLGDGWHLNAINIHNVWDHGYSFHTPDAVGLCVIGEAISDDQNGDLNITGKASFAWNGAFSSYLPYSSAEENSHEAAVASVAASTINNSIGVAGIVNAPLYSAWPWGIYPIDDVPYYRMYVQQMIDIFDWGSSFGKMVFTMSFINTVYQLELNDSVLVELQDKVTELYENGNALFFAASGNTLFPMHPKDVPQSLPYVRVIGRVDQFGFYNDGGYGDQLFLVAPAGGVPAYIQSHNGYGTFGGASCSTPIVAASAVLLWNQFPWASNTQIEDALCWGATDILETGWDEKSGYGALNIELAHAYLTEYVPSSNTHSLNWSTINRTPIDGSSFDFTSLLLNSGIVISAVGLTVLIILIKKRRSES